MTRIPGSSGVPTSADVARLAGVSKATVSYVLSGRRGNASRVSEETRKRVLDAVQSLDYVPNQSARALRRQSTERICLVVPRLGVPYHDLLARDLQGAAADNGYSMVIALGASAGQRRSVVDQLRRHLADGAVFIGAASPSGEDLDSLARAEIAVVAVSDDVSGASFDVVRSDISDVCRRTVGYLADQGHRRIAFIGHFLSVEQPANRHEDYLAGLRAHGLPVDERLVTSGAASRKEAYLNATALLQQADRPSAIFAASDIAAVSSIWAARDVGLRVPEDVAVLGVGNIPEDTVIRPRLTTVGPKSLDSHAVTEFLFSRLRGGAPAHGRVWLQEWSLILRESA
ncbi:MAG: LacI family DNA-binding transcriptional regulator [Streptosporangiaceae bacterium]